MPDAAAFDTLGAAETMTDAGIEEPHAKIIVLHVRPRLHPTPHNRQLPIVEKTCRPAARTIPQTLGSLRYSSGATLAATLRNA